MTPMVSAKETSVSLVIIDDNPGSLELLSSALAQDGLNISVASDPETGLDLVHELHPHIVLTDLVMPGLSGMEVLERVMEFDPSTDVILMTAHYSTESAVEAIRKGASDYLNKPISIATLRQRIGKLVDEARRRQRTLKIEDELLAGCEFEGIVGNSPFGVRMTKEVMWSQLEIGSLQAGIDLENRTQVLSSFTGDLVEAMQAFAEKRPAVFKDE